MAPEDVLDVERSATEALGDLDDVRRSDKQEQGTGVDEATNKPRAGYPVDLWAGARHPYSSPRGINRWNLGEGHQRKTGLPPRLESSFQHFCGNAPKPEQSRHALTQARTGLADYDCGVLSPDSQ